MEANNQLDFVHIQDCWILVCNLTELYDDVCFMMVDIKSELGIVEESLWMVETSTRQPWLAPLRTAWWLVPGLAECQDWGVDQMSDGKIRELEEEIIPGNPELWLMLAN